MIPTRFFNFHHDIFNLAHGPEDAIFSEDKYLMFQSPPHYSGLSDLQSQT